MTKFVLRRALQAIPVLFGITIVVYAILLAAPGRPHGEVRQQPADHPGAAGASSSRPGASTSRSRSSTAAGWASATRDEGDLGILPAPAAFIGPTGLPNFLPRPSAAATNGVLHGDFGYSIDRGEPVSDRIARAALPTFILAGVALVIWLAIAIVLGRLRGRQTLLAVRPRRDGLLLRRLRDAHVLARASC